jgi:hypothetical protein
MTDVIGDAAVGGDRALGLLMPSEEWMPGSAPRLSACYNPQMKHGSSVHQAATEMFESTARLEREWADSIRSDSPKAKGMGGEITRHQVASFRRVVEEVEKVEGAAPELRRTLAELEAALADYGG